MSERLLNIIVSCCIKEEGKIENNQYVTAKPVASKVVVLDAGHGVPDERSRK